MVSESRKLDTQKTESVLKVYAALDRTLFVTLLILLAWLPIPLGSNRGWAWAIMETGTMFILVGWLTTRLAYPLPMAKAVTSARVPLILFSLWLGYLLFQIIPLPSRVLQAISDATYQLHNYAIGIGAEGQGSVSIDRGSTYAEFLKYATYATIFFLVLCLVTTAQRLKAAALVLFTVGCAEALYGIVIYFTSRHTVLWDPSPGSLSGTYINRNHLAGLLEMTIPIGIGLIIHRLRPPKFYPTWKSRFRDMSQFFLEGRGTPVVLVLAMVGAIFLTTSRGGTFALFISIAVVPISARKFNGPETRETRITPWIIGLAIVAGVWFGIGGLTDKITGQGLDVNRITVSQYALKIFFDHPLFGTGAGTFERILPLYRGGDLGTLHYDHTHNDPVELLVETGIAGVVLLGSAVLYTLLRTTKSFIRRRDPFMRSILFASLTGSFALLLHGFVDFNFHIPANAAYFYTLLGMGVVASVLERPGSIVQM